jgi:hypothetical protein
MHFTARRHFEFGTGQGQPRNLPRFLEKAESFRQVVSQLLAEFGEPRWPLGSRRPGLWCAEHAVHTAWQLRARRLR